MFGYINRDEEVYFDQYCESCRDKNTKQSEEPCYTCLQNPVNEYSHKPVKYVKSEKFA